MGAKRTNPISPKKEAAKCLQALKRGDIPLATDETITRLEKTADLITKAFA